MYTATKEDTAHNLKDNMNEAKEDLRSAANSAGRKVRGFINSAGEEISHATDTVTKQIRTNPVQSSLVALGVGYLLGALFRR